MKMPRKSRNARRWALRNKLSRRPSLERLEERQMFAADITVNTTADGNTRDAFLTLREAILISNRTLAFASLLPAEQAQITGGLPSAGDADTIKFNIPATDSGHFYYKNDGIAGQVKLTNVSATTATNDGTIGDIDPDWTRSWFSIRPTMALPGITEAVTIDGYTQAGAGANTNAVGQGLNTILKIEISGENVGQLSDGLIHVSSGSGTQIKGLALNRVEGTKVLLNFSSSATTVAGNFIGSDVSGTLAFASPTPGSIPGFLRSNGVLAQSSAGGNVIGGTTPAARNLISGNNFSTNFNGAVALRDFGAASLVQGNIIGSNRTGTQVLGNAGPGVFVDSPNDVIGGVSVAAGNLISGNQDVSISLASSNANGLLIQNNKLGTNPGGTLAVGTTGGISIVNTASNNKILDNTIAFGSGIRVSSGSTGNLISRNSIFSNVGLGIDLNNDGVTANDGAPDSDPPGGDNGANKLQNYPTITSLTDLGPGTRIQGTLASTPSSSFRLEFFASAERDESDTAFAEGQTYLGFVDVSTNSSGNATFSVDLAALPVGQAYVTATATDITDAGSGPRNNTSEFSPVVTLGGASFVVTSTADSGPGSLREAIINANNTPGTQTITFNIPANDSRHFYYTDDGIAGEVSLDHIAVTTETNDASIVGIDPDWMHSWFSVLPNSNLPDIIDTIVIDGYSQAGSSTNTLAALQALNMVLKIEINGENASGDGLHLAFGGIVGVNFTDAKDSAVKGIVINRFGGDGIELNTLDGNNAVTGNFIGTDVSGTLDLGNGDNGIFVSYEFGSVIGGATADSRNLISANRSNGVEVFTGGGHTIQGNLIGGSRDYSTILVNADFGIFQHNDESIGGSNSSSTTTAATKLVPLALASSSKSLQAAFVPGGWSPGFGAIWADQNEIIFGYVPGDSENVRVGRKVYSVEESSVPLAPGVGNRSIIRPVQLHPQSTVHAKFASNTSQTLIGIDLGNDGVTSNDLNDLDSWQNYPVLTSAVTINGTTMISGTLNSKANTSFRIEFFASSFGLGFRVGEKYLGAVDINTNSQGNASFSWTVPEVVTLGQFITTTATRLEPGTFDLIASSEFSAGMEVTDTPPTSTASKDILVLGSAAGSDTRTRVKVIEAAAGQVLKTFTPYGSGFRGGVRVAVADLNGDGVAEIITAPGAGRDGLVKVFDLDGVELVDYRINAYPKSFTGGVFVATGDVNGDGRIDIITTPGSGRAAEVKVWKNRVGIASSNPDPFANSPLKTFLAFGSTFTGGATVAAGDLTGDGKAEIVVGNGEGRSPSVRVFDTTTFTTTGLAPRLSEIKPFSSSDRGGVSVAVGNVRNSSTPEIIVGNGKNGRGRVEMFNADGTRFKTINAYTDSSSKNAPVYVAVKEIDNIDESLLEIVTSQGPSGSSKRRRAWQPDATMIDDVLESDFDFRHGYFVG